MFQAALFVWLASPGLAQTPFQLTLTNTTAASWDEGVIAILPGSASPNALLPIGQSPTSGDPYDTYAYTHGSCDIGVEDDGDAGLLISRWPALTDGVNAFRVGPLGPGASQMVAFDAFPGDVVSFVAHVTGTGDDAVILHEALDPYDAAVDLFDLSGNPLTLVAFEIGGYDVNDLSPTGGGGSCAASCPPSVPCYISPGGVGGGGTAQPTTGGCTERSYYVDGDGDGFGAGAPVGLACDIPAGHSAFPGDCDDADPAVGDSVLWYLDDDGDGFGNPEQILDQCTQPVGAVADDTDCDDADPDNWASCATCVDGDGDGEFVGCDAYATRPGPDCDDTDPALNGGTTWFTDGDGDGFGDDATAVLQCTPPTSGVQVGGDCDDADAAVNPAATEVCNALDDDCDALLDDADPSLDLYTAATWYTDGDGDGYGDPAAAILACEQPLGAVPSGTDCDDADPATNPGAVETCDGADDDCNGLIDDNAIDAGVYYTDSDGDGFGDSASSVVACTQPYGTIGVGGDCDDTDPLTSPGAAEFCDGLDNDCNGSVDDNAFDATTWYVDGDMDGFGDPASSTLSCVQPPGTAPTGTDCDDTDPYAYPGAPESCDGTDEDCDGAIDNDVVFTTWWLDLDGDGWGDDNSPIDDCIQPPDTAAMPGDCDDTDPDVNPDGIEIGGNGIDEDCDGVDDPAPPGDSGLPIPGDNSRDWDPPGVEEAEPIDVGCACSQGGPSGGLGALLALGLGFLLRGAPRPPSQPLRFGPVRLRPGAHALPRSRARSAVRAKASTRR